MASPRQCDVIGVVTSFSEVSLLTRALLGLVRTLPSAGGGRIGPPIYLENQQT